MKRRLYQLAIILASLFIIQGLSRGLVELSAQDRRLGRAQTELGKLKQKEVELKQQLEYFQSDEYVEKIARDKLLMAKEGETVLILPKQDENHKSEIINHISEDKSQEDIPNWKKWAQLFGF